MKKTLYLLLILSLLTLPCEAKTPWSSKPPIGSQINWGHPLSKGLVGAWLLNEGGGLYVKDIAKNNIATLNTSGLFKNRKTSGVLFGGTDYARCIGQKINSQSWANGITIVWSGNVLDATENYKMFVTQDDTGANDYWNFGTYQTGGRVRFGHAANDFIDPVAGTILTSNKDYMLSVTYDNVTGKSYIDGRLDKQKTVSLTVKTNNELNFAARMSGTNLQTNIHTYYVYIYNRALSPSEIQQLYQEPYCFIKSGGYWSQVKAAVVAATTKFFMVN